MALVQAEAELRALQVDLGSEGETQALLSEVLGLEKHLQAAFGARRGPWGRTGNLGATSS